MKQIALSIEQMKHLESLGLDTSDASLWWYKSIEPDMGWELMLHKPCKEFTYIPAYTLQNILEKYLLNLNWDSYHNFIQFRMDDVSMWIEDIDGNTQYEVEFKTVDNILEAAYQMLVWCLENGYIKTK